MKVPGNRKKRWGFGPAFFFILASGNALTACAAEVFGRFESQFVSEPEPINTTLEDWGEEFDAGERQWAIAHLEIGVRKDGIEVSALSRALVDLRMNREAVAFYGKIARKEPLTEGEQVPVNLKVNSFAGTGLRLGYLHRAQEWSLGGGASLFRSRYLMSGDLQGEFTALADNDYNFKADVDYAYYRDVIFERPDVKASDGLGWAFDLAGAWQPSENWRFGFRAEDLFAQIRWEEAPFTVAQANTDNKSFDDDGYAVFAPTLSGREGYRDQYYQELDPRYKASVDFESEAWSAHLRGQYQFGYGFLGGGVGYRFSTGRSLKALYWPKLKSLGLELSYGLWQVSLSLDQPEWQDVRSAGLRLSYGY